MASPAAAQLALEGSIQTDFRFRGYTRSDGQPTGTLALNYDDPSGFYVGGSAAGTIHAGDPQLLLVQASAGYALRAGQGLALDAGATHSHYPGYGALPEYDFTELYVGASARRVNARLSFSPNYYRPDTPTLYAEVQTGFEPAPNWFLSAHAGALTYLEEPPFRLPRHRYDWRLGASRQLGSYAIHLEVSGRVQGAGGYAGTDKTAAVMALTRVF